MAIPLAVDSREGRVEPGRTAPFTEGPSPHAYCEVSIYQLGVGHSPRLRGQDEEHVQILAAIDGPLPPILVQKNTMRVVDGMHRLSAARMRGQRTIGVHFFEGPDQDAFVEAVRANTTHGKPLTVAEREAAASRILETHKDWSDRAIAEACGLSPKTLAKLRSRSQNSVSDATRVGRDGRVRPLNPIDGRKRVLEALADRPEAPLREIGRLAGVSPGTVRSVRSQLRNGLDPIAVRQRQTSCSTSVSGSESGHADNAFASSPEGVKLVNWLQEKDIADDDWQGFVRAVPLTRVYDTARKARAISQSWSRFAAALDARAGSGRATD